MATDHILALLVSERNKLTKAIEALQGPTKLPSVERVSKPASPARRAKRKLSAAGKLAIITATKKRWAAVKAAKAASAAPAQVAAPKSAPAKDSAFRKKMSDRMKAAWALRKKKAAGKG